MTDSILKRMVSLRTLKNLTDQAKDIAELHELDKITLKDDQIRRKIYLMISAVVNLPVDPLFKLKKMFIFKY